MTMELIACVLLAAILAQASAFKPDYRIVGGQEATPHAFPYTVALFINNKNDKNFFFYNEDTSFCGGTLISETAVLTAARCLEDSRSIEVVLGAHNIRKNEPTQVRVPAVHVIAHPEWDSNSLRNDIAILRIAPVELNNYIHTIPLPTDTTKDYENDLAIASGWGRPSDSSESISRVLRYVEVTVISNKECRSSFSINTHSHICTDGSGGKSTCNGDSGSPLKASTGELIGIASFGSSWGCEWGFPPSFTRITEFMDWINSEL